jgi:hypothetical protein
MTLKSIQVLPPREVLAAAGRTEIAISTAAIPPVIKVGGPVNATLMRWQAERESKTYRAMAESTRAQTDFVNARADLARSMTATAGAISELRELPVILDHDAEIRQANRDRELANADRETAEARYGLDSTRDEIAVLRAKQRKKIAPQEKSAIGALSKAKTELEALGRDTAAIDQALNDLSGA